MVVVMLVLAAALNPPHITIIAIATLILHLHRGVLNLIMLVQILVNALQQRVMIVRRDHLYMQRDHRLLAHLPQMHMMHVTHLRDAARQRTL